MSCALPLPVEPQPGNPRPVEHHVLRGGDAASREGLSFSLDYFSIASHGMATTHLDALCPAFSNGKMYNMTEELNIPSYTQIDDIAFDSEGTIWLGTSRGLGMYKNGSLTIFDESDGLIRPEYRRFPASCKDQPACHVQNQ